VTPAQATRERAALVRAIRAEEKRKDRKRLVVLRDQARAHRAGYLLAVAEARRACAARRRAVPTLREAAALLRAARAEARATCDASLARAGKLKSEAARSRAERLAEKQHQATMRRLERHAKERESGKVGKGGGKGGRGPRLAKARVRRDESDDEVRQNIPPELAFLFERVKRQIKGSARKTRTEEFLQYASEHPDEELAALEDKTDALIRELEARERRANPATLTAAASRKRFAVLKRAGCKPKRVVLPSGDDVVLRTKACKVPPLTNPRRPPGAWWDDCIARVTAAARATGRKVREPRAVCGAAWWNLSPQKRGAIVRKLEGSKDPRARAGALALARAEKAHRKRNPSCDLTSSRAPRRPNPPREVVSLVYLEQKPGDEEPFEYEHDFEGDRPRLEMRGGKAQLRGGSYQTRDGWLEG